MKKIVGLILGACIMVSSIGVYADGPTAYYYDGQWHTYTEAPIRVLVNGEEAYGDMPPILYKDSTLVPARAVFEKMGATLTWNESTSQVGVAMDNINLTMVINENKATVNGSVYEMKVPPKVINDRTLIPARFVVEALGMKVGWNEKERTVTIERGDIDVQNVQTVAEEGKLRVVVSSGSPITDYTSFTMEDNPRVVVDVKNAILSYKGGDITVNNPYISKIRTGQTSTKPNVSRIVADMNYWTGYTVTLSPDKKQLYIDFDCRPAEITGVRFAKGQNNESIDMDMKYARNVSLYSMGESNKVYINVPQAAFKGVQSFLQAEGNYVKSVACIQSNPASATLAIETKGPCVAEMKKNEKGLSIVFSPSIVKKLEYAFDGKPKITLKSENIGINYYNYSYRYENGNLILSVPKSTLDSGLAKMFINDGNINDISIVPNTASGTTDLIFEARSPLTYSIDSISQKDSIVVTTAPTSATVSVPANITPKMKEKIVVIDPGHGGSEAGAVFNLPSGEILKEKDLNLSISLKLYDLLKNAGFKVQMTRTDDRDMDVYERADFANNLNASFLLSVHNNAGPSNQKGTMALFYPSPYDKSYGISGERAAQIAQEEMLKVLGTNNMGMWKRPRLAVLNTARMPAVLAEVSYLTNDNDRNNLMDDNYRGKAAQALYNATLRTLYEMETAVQNPTSVGPAATVPAQWKPEDYQPRLVNNFTLPPAATAKSEYRWASAENPSLFDVSITLDYKKEVDKKATLEEQRKEAEQVLRSRLDEQTVAKIMESVSYQKDYTSYIWDDEIETTGYEVWVRCLKNTGICTIDVIKK